MADIPQVLATYDALVGVALGAGLAYGFGTLNRRHQEKREDRTRWYGARLEAYIDFHRTVYRVFFILLEEPPLSKEDRELLTQRLADAVGAVGFVGSDEVTELAYQIYNSARDGLAKDKDVDARQLIGGLDVFDSIARKDLGHPSP